MKKPCKKQRENNRQEMPTIAGVVDQFREYFGAVKVLYAEENGIKKGKDPCREKTENPSAKEWKEK